MRPHIAALHLFYCSSRDLERLLGLRLGVRAELLDDLVERADVLLLADGPIPAMRCFKLTLVARQSPTRS